MGYRIVTLKAENMTLGTGNVMLAIQTAAAATTAAGVCRIKRVEISQSGSTTLAMIRGEIAQRNNAGTLTTTSTTPTNVSPVGGTTPALAGSTNVIGTASSSGTNSSADSGGTYTALWDFNFANTAGYLWKPDPEEEIFLPPSTILCVRLLATPGTTTGWTASMVIGENV